MTIDNNKPRLFRQKVAAICTPTQVRTNVPPWRLRGWFMLDMEGCTAGIITHTWEGVMVEPPKNPPGWKVGWFDQTTGKFQERFFSDPEVLGDCGDAMQQALSFLLREYWVALPVRIKNQTVYLSRNLSGR